MDKYEFKLKVDEMKALVSARNYNAALEIAETINWRKIRNLNALVLAGEIYEQAGQYDHSKEILLMAYDKSPIGRNIIYRLAEIAIKTKNFDDAREYYDEFVDIAPHDNLKYVLKYKMTAAQGLPYDNQIKILEELKEQEYSEEWAYELALLYHKAGKKDQCVDACDELILWFGDGIYVEKALELKLHYQPLTKTQEEKYRLFRQKRAGVIEVKPKDERQPDRPDASNTSQISLIAVDGGEKEKTDLKKDLKSGKNQKHPYVPAQEEEVPVSERRKNIGELMSQWEKKEKPLQTTVQNVKAEYVISEKEEILKEAEHLMERLMDMIPQLSVDSDDPKGMDAFQWKDGTVLDDIDQAGRIVAGMNMLLQEQINSLIAEYQTAQLLVDVKKSAGQDYQNESYIEAVQGSQKSFEIKTGQKIQRGVQSMDPRQKMQKQPVVMETGIQRVKQAMLAGARKMEQNSTDEADTQGIIQQKPAASARQQKETGLEAAARQKAAGAKTSIHIAAGNKAAVQQNTAVMRQKAAGMETAARQKITGMEAAARQQPVIETDLHKEADYEAAKQGTEAIVQQSVRINSGFQQELPHMEEIPVMPTGIERVRQAMRTGADSLYQKPVSTIGKTVNSQTYSDEMDESSISDRPAMQAYRPEQSIVKTDDTVSRAEQAYELPEADRAAERRNYGIQAKEAAINQNHQIAAALADIETDYEIPDKAVSGQQDHEALLQSAAVHSDDHRISEEAAAGRNYEIPPEEAAVGGNYEIPLEEAAVGGNYQVSSEKFNAGQDYEMPPVEPAVGRNYEMPLEETAVRQNYEMPPEETAAGQNYGMLPKKSAVSRNDEILSEETAAESAVENNHKIPLEETAAGQNYGMLPEEMAAEQNYGMPPEEMAAEQNYGMPPEEMAAEQNYGMPPEEMAAEQNYGMPPEDMTAGRDYETSSAAIDRQEYEQGYETRQKAYAGPYSGQQDMNWESSQQQEYEMYQESMQKASGQDAAMMYADAGMQQEESDIGLERYEEQQKELDNQTRTSIDGSHKDDLGIKKLTPERREIFSYFVPISGMEAQIYDLLEGVADHLQFEKNSISGNIIVEGIKGSGKTVLITDIIKVLQKELKRPNGKIGRIDANVLNQKDLNALIEKVSGGCLIIESAGKISRETAVKLSQCMDFDRSGTLYILEDTQQGIQKALDRDSSFSAKFTEKISIPFFSIDELAEFGKAYANDLNYDIDEMGILALYKRINNIQKLDHVTTLTEVKEIVDEAIDNAEKGALKKVLGILTSTRYNDDNYVILREKDFE